jgi:hypothetical protein
MSTDLMVRLQAVKSAIVRDHHQQPSPTGSPKPLDGTMDASVRNQEPGPNPIIADVLASSQSLA